MAKIHVLSNPAFNPIEFEGFRKLRGSVRWIK